MSLSQDMTPEQNIVLIAADVTEVKQLVEELGAEFGEVKILVVGDGREPGLFELFRGLSLKLDSHITAEKEYHQEEKEDRRRMAKVLSELQTTELKKAMLKGSAGSGGVFGAVLLLVEFVLRPSWEKWIK